MYLKNTLYLTACTLLLSASQQQGCSKREKNADGPPSPATVIRSVDFLNKKMDQRVKEMAGAQSMTAHARVSAEGDGSSMTASANIIWIKDSIIWLNAKKFGVEGLRILVTPDSVFVLNRLEKTCSISSLESFRNVYGLPEGDIFDLLQRTLLGLPALSFVPKVTRSDIIEMKHRLNSDLGRFNGEYRIEEGSFLLKNEIFIQKSDQATAILKFDRHRKIKDLDGLFPFFRRMDIYRPNGVQQSFEIEMDDIEINSKPSYRFEIPSHYTRQ